MFNSPKAFNLNKNINGESHAGPSSNSSTVLHEDVAQLVMDEITCNSRNQNRNVVAEMYHWTIQ